MKLLAIILFFFPFLAPTPAPVPGTAPEALMTVAMVHAKPGPKALVKVLMGYISAGQVDYNLVCSQSTYPTPVYGDDATLEATDILYTDASGATMYPGQLKGYAFTVSGTGAAQYKLILYDAPDPGVHNYIHTMTACNANTTPTCGGGGNKSLTLPQNSVLLQGSGSDAQGPVTFAWTKISGPSTFTFNSTTIAQPTVSNLVQGTYVFRLTVTDNQSATCTSDVQVLVNPVDPNAPVKLEVKDIYDMDRHAVDEMGPGFHPKNWFTGLASHNPRGNGMDFTDTAGWYTKADPTRPSHYPKGLSELNGMTYYRGDRGWRMVLDMSGDKDMFKLTNAQYKITDIYGLQQGGDNLDTLFFYNFDKIFALPAPQRVIYMARPDSMMTPFAKLVQGAAISYRPEWSAAANLNDTMRYILVVMRRKERGSYNTFPSFRELVIYGKAQFTAGSINLKQFAYNGPRPKRQPMRKFLGVNNVGIQLSQLRYDGLSREYIAVGNMDDDTTAYPNNQINPNPWNWSTAYWNQELGGAKAEGRMWWESIRAGSKRLEKYGWGNVAKSIPVTEGGMDPEYWTSYDRMGNFFYHYAAVFGNNPNHNDTSFRWRNKSQLPGYGLGYRSAVEPGNEDETRGSTLLAMVVKDNVVYDGYEGRVAKAGIKKGDSTMKLIMPATVYLDTAAYKTMIFLCRLIRNDKKVIWDYFNGHHYSRRYRDPSVTEHDPTYEEMWGTRGATPEEDDMYGRLTLTQDVIWRELDGDTSKKFLMTEWGYDNWVRPSTSVAEQVYANPYGVFWTISTLPRSLPGVDSLVLKGILMCRGESWFASTPLAGYNEFMITNVFFSPTNGPGLFASSGRGAADGVGSNTLIPLKWPHYWSRASFYTMTKDYKVDTVLARDSLGLCLIKWRHESKPDSVIYEVWKGSLNGSTLSSVNISVGPTIGSNAIKRTLNFTGPVPGESTSPITTSQLQLATVTEEPKFYFLKEAASGGNLPPVANAGADIQVTLPITQATVSGTGSTDPDGTIVTYSWSKVSGPPGGNLSSPLEVTTNITSLITGVYVYKLTVVDNIGDVSEDTVTITVSAAPLPPGNGVIRYKKAENLRFEQ